MSLLVLTLCGVFLSVTLLFGLEAFQSKPNYSYIQRRHVHMIEAACGYWILCLHCTQYHQPDKYFFIIWNN